MIQPALITPEFLESKIYLIRGQKVLIDTDLAALYGVPTFRLNEQVRRNILRFPQDFMFQLSPEEGRNLISQIAISSSKHGGRRKPILAFTEQGVAMLSSVLNSERAIHVNVAIMRAFTRLRNLLASHADLVRKLDEMEQEYDKNFKSIFLVLRKLMKEDEKPKSEIGFRIKSDWASRLPTLSHHRILRGNHLSVLFGIAGSLSDQFFA